MTHERVAFVTGASRGIGAAIGYNLAQHGLLVAVGYRSNKDNAEEIVNSIRARGGEARVQHIDVADRTSIRTAVTSIKAHLGPIDILINNAALAQEKSFLSITDTDWDLILDSNLRGPFACTQEVLPGMIDRGWGRIVNIASIGGQWGGTNQIHYACAKAGLIGLTRSLAKTFSVNGVTINAVSPGLINTDMTQVELHTAEGQKKVSAIPVSRIGTTKEVANAVSFLVLPGSEYITGQTINVNGGMYFG
jgi:NAD(P)-dependent dehydrogenase (short-subunit alcohol dehydrogenase family)